MITIKHHPNGGMTCKDTSHKYGHACGYCMGCIKPRYPVPAIYDDKQHYVIWDWHGKYLLWDIISQIVICV